MCKLQVGGLVDSAARTRVNVIERGRSRMRVGGLAIVLDPHRPAAERAAAALPGKEPEPEPEHPRPLVAVEDRATHEGG